MHFADSLMGWVAGDSGQIFYTSDGGLNWNQQESNTTNRIMRLFFLDDKRGWALAWDDEGDNLFYGTEILTTTNGGENWSVEQYIEENTFMRGIYFLDTLKGFIGGAQAQFLRTLDGGINWEPVVIAPLPFAHFPVVNIKFYNSQYGFATGGALDIAGVVWKTIDGGEYWVPIETAYAPPDEIWDVHFIDSSTVLLSSGDPELFGVSFLKSFDAGFSWIYDEIGIFGVARSLGFRKNNEGWAAVPLGQLLLYTKDYGETWSEYIAPDSSSIYQITFVDSLTGYGVGENGVIIKYKYQLPVFVNEDSFPELKDFVLYQNFPNPFNSSTKINYYISQPGQVIIKIYDVLGNLIITLLDEKKASGNYNIIWDAVSEPSGIYYVQLNVDGKLSTKKMILLK
ncbi:MAG: T9SS type A sorting domain-containing protein [Ignavibacteriaceae bacterium]|nr:T9SS type A sorting domain-containing protein [Ignavibacteriaceae bacterium]